MTLVGLRDVLTNQQLLLSKLSTTEYVMTILPTECDEQINQQKGSCVTDCYHDGVAETQVRYHIMMELINLLRYI